MNTDTLDHILATMDPAPPYSPADEDAADAALAALLDVHQGSTPEREAGPGYRRWMMPLAAAVAVAALAVGIDAIAARGPSTPPADPNASAFQKVAELTPRGGTAAQPYDPKFVPAIVGGSTAERARAVCAAKFAESDEQPAIPEDAPIIAVEKRDGMILAIIGNESHAGWCAFDNAALDDPDRPAAWGPVALTSGSSPPIPVGPRDIGDLSGGGYGNDGDPGTSAGEPEWYVATTEGYAGADVRGVAAVTPYGRLPALMVGRWFMLWWPAAPATTGGGPGLTYELLLADGTVRTVRH